MVRPLKTQLTLDYINFQFVPHREQTPISTKKDQSVNAVGIKINAYSGESTERINKPCGQNGEI
jgi:hypothetical protein